MLKTFNVAPEQDSVRTAFRQGQRAASARLTLERRLAAFPEYLLKQDSLPVAILRGKEMVVGGEHFAVIPLLPDDWAETGIYSYHPDNVPYWDGEQRLRTLDVLLSNLSQGWTIPAALDDAVDAEDDEFFAGVPEVAYTGQQPEDFPEPAPLEWEPEPEQPREYLWTIWYEGRSGVQKADLTCTREMAGRVWDVLAGEMPRMLSARP